MKKTIKYQYAENSSGNLVHINEVNRENSTDEKYLCIDCKQELIPRLGNERTHHFSHKSDILNCSKETYLHELGKRIFYETYLQCLKSNSPFYFGCSLFTLLSITCKYYGVTKFNNCVQKGISKFDLTQSFKNIEFEKNHDNFRPDLTLINSYGDKIFIEIAVTHPCEKEKIDSKNKIIEISIKNESDIKIIQDNFLSESSPLLKFYNLENFNIIVEPICKDNIPSIYSIVMKDGSQHTVKVVKKELCKFVYENNNLIRSISLIPTTINLPPLYTYNRRGPTIDDIDSKLGRTGYRSKYKPKRKRK